MKLSKIAAIVLASMTCTPAFALTPYPGTAHRTDYDEFQDAEIQGTAELADLAIDDLHKTNDQVIQNFTDIGHNAADIKTNTNGIAANTGNIQTNANGIAANTAAIDATNASLQGTQGHVHVNTGSIDANFKRIMHNQSNIAQNTADITDAQKVNAEQDKQITSLNGFTGEINAELHKQAIGDIKRDKAIQDNDAAIKHEATIRSNQVVRLDQVKADKTDLAAETAAREAGDQTLAGDIKANKSGIETNAANIAANQAAQSRIDGEQNRLLTGTMSDVGSLQQRTADNENAINTVAGNVDTLQKTTTSGINANATTIGQVKAVTQGMQKQNIINNSARILSMKAAANDSRTQAQRDQQEAQSQAQSRIDGEQNRLLTGTMGDVTMIQERVIDNEHAIDTVAGNVDSLKKTTASGINANATTIGQVKSLTQGMQKQDYINNSARILSMKAAATDSHTQALIAQQTQDTDQTAAAAQKLAADDHAAIQQETTTRAQQFNTLAAGVNHAEATGAYAHARIDAANQHIAENRAALEAENAQIAQNSADIAANRQQLGQFEQSTNSKFANMDKKIDENRKHASRGIAGANALAGLPQLNQDDTFGVAAAAGGYDGESAIAVGASAHPFANKAVTVKAGVTEAQGGNLGWNVGAGLSW